MRIRGASILQKTHLLCETSGFADPVLDRKILKQLEPFWGDNLLSGVLFNNTVPVIGKLTKDANI